MKQRKGYVFLEWLYITAGTFLTGLSTVVFTNPARLAPGGVDGISTILFHTLGIDLTISMLCLNIPLILLGSMLIGKEYGAKSLAGTLLLSLSVFIWTIVFGTEGVLDLSHEMNIWVSCLFGGVLSGIGIGFVMKAGANTGGTDIIAQIIARYMHIPLGTSLFIVDGVIIAAGAFIFSLELALYAIIVAYITQLVIDKVVLSMGTNYAKTVYIISERLDEIEQYILQELDKGGTIIEAKGLYSMEEKPMLMTVVPNRMIGKLTRFISATDPECFMIIHETWHVFGEGNSSIGHYVGTNKNVAEG